MVELDTGNILIKRKNTHIMSRIQQLPIGLYLITKEKWDLNQL